MCDMCDGTTFEESLRFIELAIIRYGWAVRGVYPGVDDPTGGYWSYTVGLLENFNHPELVVVDVETEVGLEVLNVLGEEIRAGKDITNGNALGCTFRAVHSSHLDSELFTAFFNNYGHDPAPGQVWQVVLPAGRFCAAHAVLRTDLSREDHFPGTITHGPTDLQ